jgi:hypothetical protein
MLGVCAGEMLALPANLAGTAVDYHGMLGISYTLGRWGVDAVEIISVLGWKFLDL